MPVGWILHSRWKKRDGAYQKTVKLLIERGPRVFVLVFPTLGNAAHGFNPTFPTLGFLRWEVILTFPMMGYVAYDIGYGLPFMESSVGVFDGTIPTLRMSAQGIWQVFRSIGSYADDHRQIFPFVNFHQNSLWKGFMYMRFHPNGCCQIKFFWN